MSAPHRRGTPGDRDPLLEILAGKARAQAVATAARLGLAETLGDATLSTDDLAARLAVDPGMLGSLLRVLAGLDIVASPSPESWALTPLGMRLERGALGPLAAFLGAPDQWDPWSRLFDAMAGGPSAFERTFGRPLYQLMAEDPEAAARYDAAIDAFTRHEIDALCTTYDFGPARHVLDVGGGRGTLLAELLRRHAHLEGTLLDLPHVVARTGPALAAEFGSRAHAVGGDFRDHLPSGPDVFLVKHVLHNWDDPTARGILQRCAAAVPPEGRVLVIDAVLPPGSVSDTAAMLDLEMRVLTGGHQRRKPELRRLIASAGLRLDAVEPLTETAWLFVTARR